MDIIKNLAKRNPPNTDFKEGVPVFVGRRDAAATTATKEAPKEAPTMEPLREEETYRAPTIIDRTKDTETSFFNRKTWMQSRMAFKSRPFESIKETVQKDAKDTEHTKELHETLQNEPNSLPDVNVPTGKPMEPTKIKKIRVIRPKTQTETGETTGSTQDLEKVQQPTRPPFSKQIVVKRKLQNVTGDEGTSIASPPSDWMPTPLAPAAAGPKPTYVFYNRERFLDNFDELFGKFFQNKDAEIEGDDDISCDKQAGTSSQKMELFLHQEIVKKYINLDTPYRGILIYHGLGSGKTCTSIAIAEGMKNQKPIFVLTPASLQTNYYAELMKCGDPLYRIHHFWEFIDIKQNPKMLTYLHNSLNLSKEAIKRNGGAWIVRTGGAATHSNYESLKESDKNMINEQIQDMIKKKYTFVNYNGLNTKKITSLTNNHTVNPFDNAVVIIDEAHNFVLRIVNSLNNDKPNKTGTLVKNQKRPQSKNHNLVLYECLLKAQNVKVVLLSGTPIINYPNEIAVLYNIIRGYIKTWKIPIAFHMAQKKITTDVLYGIFKEQGFPLIDYIEYSGNTLTLTRTPYGFVNVFSDTAPRPEVASKSLMAVPPPLPPSPPSETPFSTFPPSPPSILSKMDEMKENSDVFKGYESSTDPAPTENKSVKPVKRTYKKRDPSTKSKKTDTTSTATSTKKNITIRKKKDKLAPKPLEKMETIQEVQETQETSLENTKSKSSSTPIGGALPQPDLFERFYYKGIQKDPSGEIDDSVFEERVIEILSKDRFVKTGETSMARGVEIENNLCFPDNKDTFLSIFINENTNTLIPSKVEIFQRRILGLTSYFRSSQEKLLPSLVLDANGKSYHTVDCPMTPHQFTIYLGKRLTEIKNDIKKNNLRNLMNVNGTYRIDTRIICNFAFPEEIKRPAPKDTEEDDFVDAVEVEESAAVGKNKTRTKKPPVVASHRKTVRKEEGKEEGKEEDANDEEQEEPIAEEEVPVEEVAEEAAEGPIPPKRKTYDDRIKEAMQLINKPEFLSLENLRVYSPKFHALMSHIQNESENVGCNLIYSNFRTIEGIGLLRLVLIMNGYEEFRIKKSGDDWMIDGEFTATKTKKRFVLYTGTETKEEKEIIRNVYNGHWNRIPGGIRQGLQDMSYNNNIYGEVIKLFLITASGSEGINLKNTRYVHIIEPYWNFTRIEQIIGRARRICSHSDLPEEQRTVQVFMYLSSFQSDQTNELLRKKDSVTNSELFGKKTLTTDEYLMDISIIKDNINKALLKAVQNTSIECKYYKGAAGAAENTDDPSDVCFTFGPSASFNFSTYPKIEQDKADIANVNIRDETVNLQPIRNQGNGEIEFYVNTENKNVFKKEDVDKYLQNNQNVLIPVGTFRQDEDGNVEIIA